MLYRPFGKTGETVSILGFGTMRLPIIDGHHDQIEQWNAADPVALLNWLAEFRQYSTSVSFRIKIEGQQLKMLQAFFRAS